MKNQKITQIYLEGLTRDLVTRYINMDVLKGLNVDRAILKLSSILSKVNATPHSCIPLLLDAGYLDVDSSPVVTSIIFKLVSYFVKGDQILIGNEKLIDYCNELDFDKFIEDDNTDLQINEFLKEFNISTNKKIN